MTTRCRAEIVKWVSQSLRPFSIVEDPGFLTLMKTGRPGYYIPSPSTVSRDAKLIFARTRERIAKLLQVSTHLNHRRSDALTFVTRDTTGVCRSRLMLGHLLTTARLWRSLCI